MLILTYHMSLLLVFIFISSSTIFKLFLHFWVFESKLPKKKKQIWLNQDRPAFGEECSWQAISYEIDKATDNHPWVKNQSLAHFESRGWLHDTKHGQN